MDLTGERFAISHGDYTATCVEAGAALTSLRHDGRALVAETPAGEVVTAGRGQVLMPWPNRLRDGAYHFAGRSYQLALSEPATHNASHGLVRWCSWHPVDVAADRVRMGYRLMAQTGYPWTLDLGVEYALGDDGLTVTLTARNRSDSPAPFAAGMHPYLDVGSPLDEASVRLPATERVLVDDRMLPTGVAPIDAGLDLRAGASLRGVRLDDCFTGLERDDDGHLVVRLSGPGATVEMWLDDAWRRVQLFTGDHLGERARQALAVEPMTAPADAFNSGEDLLVLEPGEAWTGRYGIRSAG